MYNVSAGDRNDGGNKAEEEDGRDGCLCECVLGNAILYKLFRKGLS